MEPAVLDKPPAAPPVQSPLQRKQALAKANAIRSLRAELKRDLKAGRKRVWLLILDPPEWAHTMYVRNLLIATPKLGQVKVDRFLRECRASASKTLGGLSDRQRACLARSVEEYLTK